MKSKRCYDGNTRTDLRKDLKSNYIGDKSENVKILYVSMFVYG